MFYRSPSYPNLCVSLVFFFATPLNLSSLSNFACLQTSACKIIAFMDGSFGSSNKSDLQGIVSKATSFCHHFHANLNGCYDETGRQRALKEDISTTWALTISFISAYTTSSFANLWEKTPHTKCCVGIKKRSFRLFIAALLIQFQQKRSLRTRKISKSVRDRYVHMEKYRCMRWSLYLAT